MSQVIITTDGASANNQDASKRIGGWAAILSLADDQGQIDPRPQATKQISGKLPGATNNQAELEAVKQALLALKRDGLKVVIVTDSAYVVGVLGHHWKAQQNKAIIAEIKALMAKHEVTFKKIKAHEGHAMNELADRLAVAAIQQ